MYARPLFVVVGILGPVLARFTPCPTCAHFWPLRRRFYSAFPASPWLRPALRIYAGGMNEAIQPGPESPPQAAVRLQLSVIVPTFNERDNVTTLYRRLEATLAGIAWEVVFVDDNSPDGTWDVVRGAGAEGSPRPLHPPDRAARPVRRLHRGHPGVERALCGGDRRRSAA